MSLLQRKRLRTQITRPLREGAEVTDQLFDQIYPRPIQEVSDLFWSPLPVVREVISLIKPDRSTRILDVGSGSGKFCISGALMGPGRYVGVERNEALVSLARRAGSRLRATRAKFICGDAFDLDWSEFDVVYLFNPFELQIARVTESMILSTVDNRRRKRADEELAARRLDALPPGARVVLFHPFVHSLPGGFVKVASRSTAPGPLELWLKPRRAAAAAGR